MALLQSLEKLIGGAAQDVGRGVQDIAHLLPIPHQLPNALGRLLHSGPPSPPATNAPPVHPNFYFAPNFQTPGKASFHVVSGRPGAENSQAFVSDPRGLNVMGDVHGNFWQEDSQGNKYPYTPIKNTFTSPAVPPIRPVDGPTIQNTPFYRTVNARPQMQAGGPVPLANLPRISV